MFAKVWEIENRKNIEKQDSAGKNWNISPLPGFEKAWLSLTISKVFVLGN